MTAFLLFDELERDMEPLEEHPARHAAALGMYCLIGQKCAQRMTDGAVPQPLIAKTFAAWPRSMVSMAIADLCAVGLWADVEGGLRFVDWDLRQATREHETQRREKQAERQRRRRLLKNAGKTDPVTRDVARDLPRDVTHDVPPAVTVPSSSSSSSSSDPLPERGEAPAARPGSEKEVTRFRQPLEDAVRAEFFARGATPQKAGPAQWRDGCQTIQDALDMNAFPDFASAISAFAKLVVMKCAGGEKLGFALGQVTLGKKLEVEANRRQYSAAALAAMARGAA